ncbi:uncharacterized protein LOC104045025 [Phalacrocorax carbo]|uniref:uncharacterized protein LOC104045025 n=1 Tax=Phalacrocorax carbo TaxID=9209 RepID=UPI003119C841
MASRLVPKVTSKEGETQCKEKHVVLLSPVGKLKISGCETGLHEIRLPKMSVLPSGSSGISSVLRALSKMATNSSLLCPIAMSCYTIDQDFEAGVSVKDWGISEQGRGRLRGVRRRGGDDGAAEAVHGLAARLLLRAGEDGDPSRAGLPPPAAPTRFVHQASAVDPVERREVWRGRFLQAISRARREQQSGESGGRSDEEQSYPNYNPVPQGDLQQRADGQLRRRKPDERVAFVAREAPEREVSILMQLSRGC